MATTMPTIQTHAATKTKKQKMTSPTSTTPTPSLNSEVLQIDFSMQCMFVEGTGFNKNEQQQMTVTTAHSCRHQQTTVVENVDGRFLRMLLWKKMVMDVCLFLGGGGLRSS